MLPSRLVCVLIGFIAISCTVQSQQLIYLLPDPLRHDIRSPAIRQTLLQIVVCPNGGEITGSFQSSVTPVPVTVFVLLTQDIVDYLAPATARLIFLGSRNTTMDDLTISLSLRCGSTGPFSTSTVTFDSTTSPYLLEAPLMDPVRINHTAPVGESILQLTLASAANESRFVSSKHTSNQNNNGSRPHDRAVYVGVVVGRIYFSDHDGPSGPIV